MVTDWSESCNSQETGSIEINRPQDRWCNAHLSTKYVTRKSTGHGALGPLGVLQTSKPPAKISNPSTLLRIIPFTALENVVQCQCRGRVQGTERIFQATAPAPRDSLAPVLASSFKPHAYLCLSLPRLHLSLVLDVSSPFCPVINRIQEIKHRSYRTASTLFLREHYTSSCGYTSAPRGLRRKPASHSH